MLVFPEVVFNFSWKARKESAAEWAGFRYPGEDDREHKLGTSLAALEKALLRGRNLDEFTGEPDEELGYLLVFDVTGGDSKAVSRGPFQIPRSRIFSGSVSCGCCSEAVDNVVSCDFPLDTSGVSHIDQEAMLKLCRSAIDIWEPEHGVVYYSELRNRLPWTGFDTQVGWVTYLTPKLARITGRLANFNYEAYGKNGVLIWPKYEFNPHDKKHFADLVKLQKTVQPA
jgi:hypothetical protein